MVALAVDFNLYQFLGSADDTYFASLRLHGPELAVAAEKEDTGVPRPSLIGAGLVFAEMKDPVRAKIERYQLTRTIDPAHFFPTLDAAIAAFRAETGAEWLSPETRAPL